MKRKDIYKKTKIILIPLLIAVLGIGSIAFGILASRTNLELRASIISVQKAKKAKVAKKSRISKSWLIPLLVPLELTDPFEICGYTPPENPEYKGGLIEKAVQIKTNPGEKTDAAVYLKNTGNVAWFGDKSGCYNVPYIRLGTSKEKDRNSVFYNPGDIRWVQANRIAMVERRVDPGQIATFTFTVNTPSATDIFREYFQPVVEGKQWMEAKEATGSVDIYVGETTPENEKSLRYLNRSGQASALDLNGEPVIEVDISDQTMIFKFGETVVREYKVSTGTFSKPTPFGRFKILNKQDLRIANKYPHYRMPMWQGFTPWGHGLHGLPSLANDRGVFWNEALNHIGQRVSHGCIRLLPEDAADLYTLTEIGIAVVVHA